MSDAHFFNPKLFLSPLLWGKTELGESAHCILDWILSVRCFVLHKIRHTITVKNHLRVWRIYVWKFLNYILSQQKSAIFVTNSLTWFLKKNQSNKKFQKGRWKLESIRSPLLGTLGCGSRNSEDVISPKSSENSVALEENHSLKEPDIEIIFWAKPLFFTVQDSAGF